MGRHKIVRELKKCEATECSNTFEVISTSKKKKRFCCKSCSNKWQHENGVRKCHLPTVGNLKIWIAKYGEEIAAQKSVEYSLTMSKAIKNADMSKQKVDASKRFTEMNIAMKGKTLDEIYGLKRSQDMRLKRSTEMMGSKNPAYGRVYSRGGRSLKGTYKGYFFRSLLEYSFMKYLEKLGISLINVDYECFTIPYSLNGHDRTYKIDFFVEEQKIVYEIKQFFVTTMKNNDEFITKSKAAIEFLNARDIEYRVMTEKDFEKIAFDVALNDPDVIWDKRTFEYFRDKNAKK